MAFTNKERWLLAKSLYTCWLSAHGVRHDWENKWTTLDEWEKGYWYSVAEYVFDYYTPKTQI